MAAGDEKPKLRCLDAARCAVAIAVTLLILVVIVCAVVVVLRPGNVIIRVREGYVSVKNASFSSDDGANNMTLGLTIRASNPSGRVRIYFTGILGNLSGQIDRSSPAEDFFLFQAQDTAVGLQESADIVVEASAVNESNFIPPKYFNQLFYGRAIPNAMLKLSGNRTVENYSGHNDTPKFVVYYCPSIIIGGGEPEETPADLQCSEDLPAASDSS